MLRGKFMQKIKKNITVNFSQNVRQNQQFSQKYHLSQLYAFILL